ncbi:MAG TPA: hypothetical protein VHG71_08190 [Verrucomicrobiae bacterium]|nr:hypothetical protein [Verrucomicrobiae bacterium]
MTHFFILAAIFLAAQISARADLVKSSVLESNVAYLLVGGVGKNLPDEIQSAESTLAASNKIAGTVLDLRFANGDDAESAKAAADLFGAKKLPLAILVNGETRGAATALAMDLHAAKAGLVFGSASENLQPDISVAVSASDEKNFLKNPFGTLSASDANFGAGTNQFLPMIDHISEADLVRQKIKDGDEDESTASSATEPQQPFIRDPVLARAVDLIQGLAVVRQSRL